MLTTVESRAEADFIEKKSKFIGQIMPVTTEQQALDFIRDVKKTHSSARHNVFAYVLKNNNITRYTDDGEPHGTAGIKVLGRITSMGLTNVCVVVTRYFGGVLLGKGGLSRAYSKGAQVAIEAAKVVTLEPVVEFSIDCPYAELSQVEHLVKKTRAEIVQADYGQSVLIRVSVPQQNSEFFKCNCPAPIT